MVQRCSNYDYGQPVACKACGHCKTSFPKHKKDLEKLKMKNKTNITHQKDLMQYCVSKMI